MNQLLKQVLLICMYLFVLTGQASAEPLSEINTAAILGDYKKVAKLTRLQAEQGDAMAQAQLGDIYHGGKGVPQDFKEALKWYRLAAEQGNVFAQYRLGFMYSRGEGVLKDYVLAYMWANISAANEGLKDEQARKDNTFVNQTNTIEREAVAQGVIKESQEAIIARDLENRQATFRNSGQETVVKSTNESVRLAELHRQQLDEITALNEDHSFAGWLTSKLFLNHAIRNANETATILNAHIALREDIRTEANKVADFQKSMLPTKLPAQEAVSKATIMEIDKQSAATPSGTPKNFEQLMSAGLRDSLEEQMTVGQIAEAQQFARKCTANKFKGC